MREHAKIRTNVQNHYYFFFFFFFFLADDDDDNDDDDNDDDDEEEEKKIVMMKTASRHISFAKCAQELLLRQATAFFLLTCHLEHNQ